MLPLPLEYKPKVFSVLLRVPGVYQDVINENHHKDIKVPVQDILDQMHKLRRGIGNTKRHHHEREYTQHIVNVVFRISSFRIGTCQYPDFKSILPDTRAPSRRSIIYLGNGKGYRFLIVLLLSQR